MEVSTLNSTKEAAAKSCCIGMNVQEEATTPFSCSACVVPAEGSQQHHALSGMNTLEQNNNSGAPVGSHVVSSSSSAGDFVSSESKKGNSHAVSPASGTQDNSATFTSGPRIKTNVVSQLTKEEAEQSRTEALSVGNFGQESVQSGTDSANDSQKKLPSCLVTNARSCSGSESTTHVLPGMRKQSERAVDTRDVATLLDAKFANASNQNIVCGLEGTSIVVDSKQASFSPSEGPGTSNTEEAGLIDACSRLKLGTHAATGSSPSQELYCKSKANFANSCASRPAIQGSSGFKHKTSSQNPQETVALSSFLCRSNTIRGEPGNGTMDTNVQAKATTASKETDALLASLTSLSQSLTRGTSGPISAGGGNRPSHFQTHCSLNQHKGFLGNYATFSTTTSHKNINMALSTEVPTPYVPIGNVAEVGHVNQTGAFDSSSASACMPNLVRKNDLSGNNVSLMQFLGPALPHNEEAYSNYSNTVEYHNGFSHRMGIPQGSEKTWARCIDGEFHRSCSIDSCGAADGISRDDHVLTLPLGSVHAGGCIPAKPPHHEDGFTNSTSENGVFKNHLGTSAVSVAGSSAAAAAAVLAQQESRPLLLTRFEMLEAYAKGRLCLSCDSKSHRMPSCPYGEFVCPNCHRSSHRGEECPLRCRFCQQLHVGISVTVCIKRFRGPLEALLGISLPLRDLQPASLMSMGTPASPLGHAACTRPNSAFGRSVYVSNLPPNTTQETLAAAVDALLTKGRIMQVDLHEKHAFVQLSTLEAAFELVDKRRQLQIRGVTLKVQFKKTGVFNNSMPHGSATVSCALPPGTNTGATPTLSSAYSPNTARNTGNQSGTSAITPLSAASSPTGACGPGASPTFSPSLNSLLIFLGPPASPSVSEICTQVAAKLKEDLHMGLVTAQQQSPSASPGTGRTSAPVRLSDCSESKNAQAELQHQLSGVMSVPFDDPTPQSTTVAALFSAAAAAANTQASGGGSLACQSAAALQSLACSDKISGHNQPISAHDSASFAAAAAQYMAKSLLNSSVGNRADFARAGIHGSHPATATGGGECGGKRMAFSPEDVGSPSCGLNLLAESGYHHSATLPSQSPALNAFQSYASIDGSVDNGAALKGASEKNTMQTAMPLSCSNTEGFAMKTSAASGCNTSSNISSQGVLNGSNTNLQHPPSWARTSTRATVSSAAAPGVISSIGHDTEQEQFVSQGSEEAISSGETTQQLLDVAATLMHRAVEETADVEEIAQVGGKHGVGSPLR
ncbi:hypothetical protein BESB_074700 [Besnoitia besnoiti]|uniref:RRM domain-containing protein n=1 Tax=Besnoitia besnoiti TaxID=94643 RepID=A0A2A9M773_BESBE|nr:uncharacterized protein BESB_074700 [Besnoitia besnoiti]PFH34318.1 hypothetical protein BESB_074700 [Besnoitia besnoiti]